MQINKSGKFYSIKRNGNETNAHLIERGWAIVNGLHLENNESKSHEEIKHMEKESRIMFNYNVLECRYPDNVEKRIKDLEKKIFV